MKKCFRIRIHPAGAVIFALAFFFLPSREVLACAVALLWHECAHMLAMYLCGAEGCEVELTPFGGMADAKHFERLSPIRQAISAAAGVAASALGAWLCWYFHFWQELFECHLSLALFNVLPLWPLDGGRMLMAAAISFGRERAMKRVFSCAAWIAGAALSGLGVYGCWLGYINPTLLVAGPYLCYAARMGMLNERVRGMRLPEEKLQTHLPAALKAFVCDGQELRPLFTQVLARFSPDAYHILFQLNKHGQLCRLWTEHEMMQTVLEEETPYIGSAQNIDKSHSL